MTWAEVATSDYSHKNSEKDKTTQKENKIEGYTLHLHAKTAAYFQQCSTKKCLNPFYPEQAVIRNQMLKK